MTDRSNGYERVAAEFLEGRGRAPSTAIGTTRVREWARTLPRGAAVIDMGCGTGLPITKDEAIRWITINPAWALGLDDRIGSIEVGKNADLVLWSGDPFSVYTRAERVWIDGALLFDRHDPTNRWRSDFELGFVPTTSGGAR